MKTVDGDKIRILITGKSDIMNVTSEKFLYFPTRIDIIHVGVDNHPKHHFRMIGTTARFLIKLLEIIKIDMVNTALTMCAGAFAAMFLLMLCGKELFG